MNAIEKGLRRGIPLEKAASFFINLKHGGRQLSAEDDALMAAAIKQAHAAPPVVPAPPPPPPSLKEASARFDALVGKYKTAGEDGMPTSSEAVSAPRASSKDAPDEYLQAEMEAQAAEDQNSVVYYQQCLEKLRLTTAEAEQRAADAEMRAQELEAQQQAHESQMAASQQEMQIAHAAAMQQVEQANAMATQAMSGQVAASNQALQAKATETTAKIQGQQLRTQLFDLAAEGLPGTEPDLGGAGSAAEGVEPLAEGATAAEAAPGDPTAGAGAEGDTAAGEATPDLEGTEAPLAAGGQESVAGGDAGADTGGMGAPASAAEGPGAEAAAPDAGATPAVAPQAPPKQPETQKQPGVSIKVGSAAHLAKIAAGLPEYLRRPEIIGALAGGAVGAGLTGAEAASGGGHLDHLRERIAENEEATKQPGVKGFAQAFELAKDKALLTLGEATQNHPVAATITGGLAGAGVGYGAGPQLKGLVSEAVAHHAKS